MLNQGAFLLLRFFLPLCLTWVLTSLSHYIVAAALTRTINPTAAFAAYTLGWTVTVLFEAPGVTLRAAATSMGTNEGNWATVQRTFWGTMVFLLGLLLLLFWTPLSGPFLQKVMGIPADLVAATGGVARITMFAVIGSSFRFVYHGILLRWRSTDGLLAGILARLTVMAIVAWIVTVTGWPGGALSGALTLTAGMVMEGAVALVGYLRARSRPHEQHWSPTPSPQISPWQVLAFITPLAISGLVLMLGRPILNAGLVQAGAGIVASFAIATILQGVLQVPCSVLHQVTMVFGVSGAVSRRQALLFAIWVGLTLSVLTAFLAFPPVGHWILGSVIGAADSLIPAALQVIAVQIPMPLLLAVSDHYTGLLLAAGRTRSVSVGRISRFACSVLLLFGAVRWGDPAYIAGLASATLVGGVLVELGIYIAALSLGETQHGSAATRGVSRPG